MAQRSLKDGVYIISSVQYVIGSFTDHYFSTRLHSMPYYTFIDKVLKVKKSMLHVIKKKIIRDFLFRINQMKLLIIILVYLNFEN